MRAMKQWRLLEDVGFSGPNRTIAIEEAIPTAVEKGVAPNMLRIDAPILKYLSFRESLGSKYKG